MEGRCHGRLVADTGAQDGRLTVVSTDSGISGSERLDKAAEIKHMDEDV